jgi:hypothetical protein
MNLDDSNIGNVSLECFTSYEPKGVNPYFPRISEGPRRFWTFLKFEKCPTSKKRPELFSKK